MLTVLDLSSACWTLCRLPATDAPFPASVPGCAHTALRAIGAIPDFGAPDAEAASAWVGENDWLYCARFDVDSDLLARSQVELVAESLDCLATVRLNGVEIGRADNAFRVWRWPLGRLLRATDNVLEIGLASPLREIAARAAAPVVRHGVRVETFIARHAWLRRMACNHGWDWGPAFPTLGLGPIRIEASSDVRLESVRVVQVHGSDGSVSLDLHPELSQARADVSWLVALIEPDGHTAHVGDALAVEVPAPRLWWPNGLGAQPLYTLVVELRDSEGRVLDTWRRRLGLRSLGLVQEADPSGVGRSFGFVVNGRPFFAKGANWIPAELFPHRPDLGRLRALLSSAAGAHMNMLRVWGGGIYESEAFYDLCDELGLLVWQDFMFACARYPVWDEAWLENVRAEAEDQVRRLRHRACLALWCGNNEIEHNFVGEKWAHEPRLWTDRVMGRADYDRLFRDILGGTVRSLDPATAYITASPHDPLDPSRWPGDICGDNHYWDAWFWGVPFSAQRSSRHRFVSEFGFQSLPSPELLARLGADLDAPAASPVNAALLARHQRCHGGDAMLARYATRECGSPGLTLRAYCARTQLVQGLALKAAIEHWRASFGRTRGALLWQLNDIWPALSWSLLDSDLRAKPALAWVRHAFAPLLLAGFEDRNSAVVRLVAVNDLPHAVVACLRWSIRASADGRVLESRVEPPVTLPGFGGCFDLGTIELLHHANREGGLDRVFSCFSLHAPADASAGQSPLAENYALLASPGEFAAVAGPGAALPASLGRLIDPLRVS